MRIASVPLPSRTTLRFMPSAPLLEQRIDEGCNGRSLRENDEPAEEHEHDDDREQPKLLALAHEHPELDCEFAHLIPPRSELSEQMRTGPRRPSDAIGRCVRLERAVHRVTSEGSEHESDRRDDDKKDESEDQPRIDPSQNRSERHPCPM